MHAGVDVPDGDILLHAGDFTDRGTAAEAADFAAWLLRRPHPSKFVVPGNHDVYFGRWVPGSAARRPSAVDAVMRKALGGASSAHYLGAVPRGLPSPVIEVESGAGGVIRVSGAPCYVEGGPGDGIGDADGSGNMFDFAAAGNLDILLTHGPPFGTLDTDDPAHSPGARHGPHALAGGCRHAGDLRGGAGPGAASCDAHGSMDQEAASRHHHYGSWLLARHVGRHPPRIHAFGHVHQCRGRTRRGGTEFINCSLFNPGTRAPDLGPITRFVRPGRGGAGGGA